MSMWTAAAAKPAGSTRDSSTAGKPTASDGLQARGHQQHRGELSRQDLRPHADPKYQTDYKHVNISNTVVSQVCRIYDSNLAGRPKASEQHRGELSLQDLRQQRATPPKDPVRYQTDY